MVLSFRREALNEERRPLELLAKKYEKERGRLCVWIPSKPITSGVKEEPMMMGAELFCRKAPWAPVASDNFACRFVGSCLRLKGGVRKSTSRMLV